MEDRVVTAINGISSIDIRTYRIAIAFIGLEDLCFVSAGMSPENMLLVNVISVGWTPSRMIWGETQSIEILGNRHDRGKTSVMSVRRRGKAGFDQLAYY